MWKRIVGDMMKNKRLFFTVVKWIANRCTVKLKRWLKETLVSTLVVFTGFHVCRWYAIMLMDRCEMWGERKRKRKSHGSLIAGWWIDTVGVDRETSLAWFWRRWISEDRHSPVQGKVERSNENCWFPVIGLHWWWC